VNGAYLYRLGVTPYGDAVATMNDLAAARGQGAIPDTVMLLEHLPVITLGSRAVRGEELLLAAVEYTRRGIEVVEVSRGGRSTYHGPGQLVCYAPSGCRSDGGLHR
jgi:lipoyl(octanoyl) transferase